MSGLWRQSRSFSRPLRLLILSQFTINIGFYMLMPYLATHLSLGLGLAGWLVGLILGARNFSQQGMFFVGGALADRFGYKPLIVAGCALRTAGFAMLGLAGSAPALVVASLATGFAGALFSPAVRAYVAREAGERRVEAFAVYNVFYQAGVLLAPLIGLVLTAVSFELTCLVAASVFGVLTVVHIRSLPHRRELEPAGVPRSLSTTCRIVTRNSRFLVFSAAMAGSYVLTFQIYLAFPLETRRLLPSDTAGAVGVGTLFALSGLMAVVGQTRVTAWCRRRWAPGSCLVVGLALMGLAFVGPMLTALADAKPVTSVAGLTALLPLLSAVGLLTLGMMITFPFEMDTIVSLARDRLVATHYGLYSTICGVGIVAGNLGTGSALDVARRHGAPWAPWAGLVLIGLASAAVLHRLNRSGRLAPPRDERAGVPVTV